MYNEMSQYFEIAEVIYNKIFDCDEVFLKTNPVEILDEIMQEVVRQASKNNLKLKYKSVDFESCLTVPITERTIKIDLSLFCMLRRRDEMVPWLANFIKTVSINRWSIRTISLN
ncbi:hypothetical protein J0G17_18400 [Acinetobacter nosocomialis]|nr:hypothetical protein [Acinetobacter nosocomialis]